MYKYAIAALCFLAACDAAIVPIKANVSKRDTNPFGIVEGIISCGSAGQIRQVRVTDCTVVPCHVVVGRVYTVEIDFIPSAAHSALHLNVTIIHNGVTYPVLSGEVENSAVQPGFQYTFTYPITITGGIFTGLGDLRIEIGNNNIMELCGIAGINIVPAISGVGIHSRA